ncbi:MAG: HAD family hydrolase [Syntrophorhabdaceae bacterium]|nr:HAD family hydrolase [Syntrophorhabdaceae bacterium]
MKKVISFDLDGTLVSSVYGDMVWNHGIPMAYGEKYGIPFEEAKKQVIEEYKTVGDSNIVWYEMDYWIRRFGLTVTTLELIDRYTPYIRPIDGADTLLRYLKGRYTLVISSNAARIFVEKELEVSGLGAYFDHVISATSDYEMVKKELGFYRKLCERFGVKPEEVVHIGDNREFDFEVPSLLGIEAYHYMDGGSAPLPGEEGVNKERVIKSLYELMDRL